MEAKVFDIIKAMETIAPIWIAEEWDNVGLQIGRKDWPVQKIWVSLDPGPDVVNDACRNDVDLLITHHPLIFHPLKSIDLNTAVGGIIQHAVRHHLAIFSAHTNLDNAIDGLNDVLAKRIGINNLKVLGKVSASENYKLVLYAPVAYEQQTLDAIFETKAGEIGSYTCCTFRNKGTGTYRPESSSKPFVGKVGEITHAGEIRVETVVRKSDLNSVIEHVRKNHPYETMAYDIYPLIKNDNRQGSGRIGDFGESTELISLARSIKKKLGLNSVKIAGNPDLKVKTAAVCTGSGSSLMNAFISSGAQVYISGDFRYHDARAVEAANLGLIDIGHFASEHLIVDVLADRLKKILSKHEIYVKVEAYGLENDPFIVL
ncbi:MAG: Nif3-like dinuclear metal center hexameric protein [Desulfobacterales bacterium]|jgi:dinuclear metal center YbgI/SA1388 family protein